MLPRGRAGSPPSDPGSRMKHEQRRATSAFPRSQIAEVAPTRSDAWGSGVFVCNITWDDVMQYNVLYAHIYIYIYIDIPYCSTADLVVS